MSVSKISRKYNFQQGEVLLIDKPKAWTSFDVVKKVRHLVKVKVGHAGTLDPLATGLLILCTGKYTKKIDTFQNLSKEYVGTMILGARTSSYDAEMAVEETFPFEHITDEWLKSAAAKI